MSAIRRSVSGALLFSFVLGLSASAGCAARPAPHPDESSSDTETAVGTLYDDLSENFTLTVYPSTVYRDGSTIYVSYRATVVNKSQDSYQDFYPAFVFDPALDQYFAAGVEPVPITEVDLFPTGAAELENGSGGRGVELVFDQLVSDREFLDDAGLDASRILDLGEEVTLWLRWNGGEEKLEYRVPVEDPDNLLGS